MSFFETRPTAVEDVTSQYPPNGVESKETAFIIFTFTSFYSQLARPIQIDPSEYSAEKLKDFGITVYEFKKPERHNAYLIIEKDVNEKVLNAFWLLNGKIFQSHTLSQILRYNFNSIISNIYEIIEKLSQSIKIDPFVGHVQENERLNFDDFTTPLPNPDSFINDMNIQSSINNFLTTKP
ncbi:Uncharacterized protein QTN25_000009 [Entamoeba marina]